MLRNRDSADSFGVESFFVEVLARAIAEVREERAPVYTFAFYHDHECAAVSVCVDTEENSARAVESMNAYRIKHFARAVADGDLQAAARWNANEGRSLSLGDFALVNVARTSLDDIAVSDDFYLLMVRALRAHETDILPLAGDPTRLLFCCSGPKSEVAYVWPAATKKM